MSNPDELSRNVPDEVAVSVYPFAAFVDTVKSWAAIFPTLVSIAVGVFPSIPRFTNVEVEVIPELVVSVFVQPVVFPVLIADPFEIPAIVKVRLGSTVACICTESIIPTAEVPKSSSELAASWVDTLIFQASAVPAVAVFVGFIISGDWVVHDEEVDAVHPRYTLTTDPADIEVDPSRVIVMTPGAPDEGSVSVIVTFDETSAASSNTSINVVPLPPATTLLN